MSQVLSQKIVLEVIDIIFHCVDFFGIAILILQMLLYRI